MIQEGDIEEVAGVAQLLGLLDVCTARSWITARMVVEEDNRRGVAVERFFDDAPVVYRRGHDCPDGDHLLGQRHIGRIEEENPRFLVVRGL